MALRPRRSARIRPSLPGRNTSLKFSARTYRAFDVAAVPFDGVGLRSGLQRCQSRGLRAGTARIGVTGVHGNRLGSPKTDTSTLSNGYSAAVTGLKRGSRVAASTACSATSLPSERWATSEPMHPRSRPPLGQGDETGTGLVQPRVLRQRMDAVESAAVGCSICSRSRIAARASFSSTSPWDGVPDVPKSSAPARASPLPALDSPRGKRDISHYRLVGVSHCGARVGRRAPPRRRRRKWNSRARRASCPCGL